jgi:predicted RNA binding protein YcfA (HicA-like mRNA interferase family)
MARWLKEHGFELQPGKATGHQYWTNGGCKITLPGHGPQDLTKKHVALIIRALERAGFNRDEVRRDLGA